MFYVFLALIFLIKLSAKPIISGPKNNHSFVDLGFCYVFECAFLLELV